MKVKQIADMDTALYIYYRYSEIGNKQIRELFGGLGSAALARYKKAVQEAAAEQNIQTAQLNTVNTTLAYEVWGIDVNEIEKRREKLKKLGLAAS